MPDLHSFITELLKEKRVTDSILELSDRVSSEPCLREILLLARETDQFNRGLKTNNEKEAGFNLRECLELSILKSKKDYLHNPGRRIFKALITKKIDNLRQAKNRLSVKIEQTQTAETKKDSILENHESSWSFDSTSPPQTPVCPSCKGVELSSILPGTKCPSCGYQRPKQEVTKTPKENLKKDEIYLCPSCKTYKLTKYDLGNRCPGCGEYVTFELKPSKPSDQKSFRKAITPAIRLTDPIRSLKANISGTIAGILLISIPLLCATIISIIPEPKTKHKSYLAERVSQVKFTRKDGLLPGKLRILVERQYISNIEQLYSLINTNLSNTLSCEYMSYLTQVRFDNDRSMGGHFCAIESNTSPTIISGNGIVVNINQDHVNKLSEIANRSHNNYKIIHSTDIAELYQQKLADSHRTNYSWDNDDLTQVMSSYKRPEYPELANTKIISAAASKKITQGEESAGIKLYRNKNLTREWLKKFAFINGKGYIKSNFLKPENHLLAKTYCLGKRKTTTSSENPVVSMECYSIKNNLASNLIIGTRIFNPQIPLVNTFKNKASKETKTYECHPEENEYIFNRLPLLNIDYNHKETYTYHCGESKVKLIFKWALSGTHPRSYDSWDTSMVTHTLTRISDKHKKIFEARRITDKSFIQCQTKNKFANDTIAIWYICDDPYQLYDDEMGLPTNTSLKIRAINRLIFISKAKMPEIQDPQF